jgi:hypothetical protein
VRPEATTPIAADWHDEQSSFVPFHRAQPSLPPRTTRRPSLFFAHLFGPGVEPGYGPIHLPKFHVVTVDEPPGGFDGGLVINAIQLNHANGSVV